MREIGKALVVVSAVALAACTRAPEGTATTEAPAAPSAGAESPTEPTATAAATATATEAPTPPAAETPTPTAAETPTPTAAETPTPTATASPPPPPIPATPAPSGAPDPRDDATLYRWEDANGDLHYTVASEVPRDRARTARRVTADVSAVGVEPVVVPTAGPPSGAIAESKPSAPPPAATAPAQPPGQKRSTRNVDDINRIYKTGLDADAMDEQYEQQKKDMKCRTVDGVVICG